MIPLHLKISGIYSYREPQEIDFRTLTSSHLFGIFGAVGSGKSALLEAIMFALYGETERLNSREMRAYNMMNLKSNEAFILFDFQAPDGKGQYRAVAKGKRNSRKFDDVKFERFLYKVAGSDLIPVETSAILEILGISYENFRRTIIIPQGKFQEFLQLGAKDRTDMVKELFNLQKFDLAARTGSLQKKNDQAISNCEGRLQQLGDISKEQITKQQAELEELMILIEQTRNQLKEKEIREAEYTLVSALFADLKNRNTLKSLEHQKDDILKAENLLLDFDECVTNFKSDFDLLDHKRLQIQADESMLGGKKTEFISAKDLLRETETQYLLARAAYDSREPLLQQARELDLCAQINSHYKFSNEISDRIINGEKLLKEVTLNLESLKAKSKVLNGLQETLKQQMPDIALLQKLNDWFAQSDLLKERQEAQLRISDSDRREFNSLIKELAILAENCGIPASGVAFDNSGLLKQIDSRKKETEIQLQSFNQQLLHLEVQEKLNTFASELRDGEPCPLCGSMEHPNKIGIRDIENQLEDLRLQKSVTDNLFELLGTTHARAGLLIDQLSRKKPVSDQNQKDLDEAEKTLLNHKNTYVWPDYTREKLTRDLERYHLIRKEIQELDEQVKKNALEMEEEGIKGENYAKLLESLRIEYSRAQQNAETLQSQLTVIDYSTRSSITSEALTIEAQKLLQQYKSIGDTYATAEKSRNDISARVQSLSGNVETLQKNLILLSDSISELSKQLEARILASRFGNETAIREILTSKIDRLSEQQRIQCYRETLSSVKLALEKLEKQLDERSYDASAHELLKHEITSLKTLLDELNNNKGAIENILSSLKRALEESRKLKSELKTLLIRSDNIKTLSDLFRAHGFVNFVSTMYLQNLVSNANDRFYRLTRQQLKLELDEENNFRIRDYLNEGQWRNVKTLSGGQTFQASLCLALALADNIQQLNQSGQNFFFLDEGFGTLDRESLEQVFETLKSLRRENRVVGVISHVEDLLQEINAFLRITLDDEHGSVVKTSWE